MSVLPEKREPPLASPPAGTPSAAGRQATARGQRGIAARLRAGELDALPVIISLMFTWVIFQTLDPNHRFLTAANLSNMVVQIAAVGMMTIGITLVLLLRETDLSVGSVSGLVVGTGSRSGVDMMSRSCVRWLRGRGRVSARLRVIGGQADQE